MTYEEILKEYLKEFGCEVHEAAPYLREKQQGEFTVEDYFDLPGDLHVELIDGVLYYLNTPSSMHQLVASQMFYELETHIRENKGKCIPCFAPWGVQLVEDEDTVLQPDVFVVCQKDKIIKSQILGAPDLVVEVLSPSTKKKDTGIKYTKYKKGGVREYWMIDLEKEMITVCEFLQKEESRTTIYGLGDKVPVGIFDGKCVIDFGEIFTRLEGFFS